MYVTELAHFCLFCRMWNEGAVAGLLIVLSGGDKKQFLALKSQPPYQEMSSMHMLRLQLPHTRRFITRHIYYVKLDPEKSNGQPFKCCLNTKRLEWMSMETVANGLVKQSWGPEMAKFCSLAMTAFTQEIAEYTLEDALAFVPRDPPRNLEESILRSIQITEKDVERLYLDFLDHCFPSAYKSIDSFKNYMKEYAFESNDTRLERLFKAFNQQNNGRLSFHEFLIGLALMEPFSQHGELRTSFIFRYYDYDGDGYLSKEELSQMVGDIYSKESKEEIAKKVAAAMVDIPNKPINGRVLISLDNFCEAVGEHKFRGTSNLCRAPKDIFSQISRAIAERTLLAGATTSLKGIVFDRNYKGHCMNCLNIKYRLATHKVRLTSSGALADVQPLEGDAEDGQSSSESKRSGEILFNDTHPANVLLKKIRLFNQHKGTNINPNGLMTSQAEELYKMLQHLCNEVSTILKQETKCQKVTSPCFVLGDTHGNLEVFSRNSLKVCSIMTNAFILCVLTIKGFNFL